MSFSSKVTLRDRENDEVITGRALICRCFRGTRYSLNIRVSQGGAYIPIGPVLRTSPYLASKKEDDQFPVAATRICDQIYQKTLLGDSHAGGLVVVSGATASLKSHIARGLIFKRFEALVKSSASKRRPHLLTFEDPIEEEFFKSNEDWLSPERVVDYTPRERGIDANCLEDVVRDSLRQTPAAFYVGEVRDAEDWRALMEFAGSGHLAVTTTHAGSLAEAIERILVAVNATSPAERGYFAQRLQAVVHLRALTVVGAGTVVVPAMWRGQPAGIARLVSDGLASVLPNSIDDQTSLGRAYFSSRLGLPAQFQELALAYDIEGN